MNVFIKYNEELLPLIGLDYVVNDIIRILDIDSHHLDSFSSILDWLHYLIVYSFIQTLDPYVIDEFWLLHYSSSDEFGCDKEVLMNVMDQVLQIGVYAGFCVDCFLITCQ